MSFCFLSVAEAFATYLEKQEIYVHKKLVQPLPLQPLDVAPEEYVTYVGNCKNASSEVTVCNNLLLSVPRWLFG